ncbi:hypothetical protein OWM07_10190 [Deferribacter thermophilus]|uniref:hypothetical protein n=1 Tax=Deferribacter thermophilus TaxID=53573 RepID=UPI003C199DBB
MARKKDQQFEKHFKLKKNKIVVRLKKEYIDEIKDKVTVYRLQNLFGKDLAFRIIKGEETNITMKTFYRLCELMGWSFPDYFEIDIIDSNTKCD